MASPLRVKLGLRTGNLQTLEVLQCSIFVIGAYLYFSLVMTQVPIGALISCKMQLMAAYFPIFVRYKSKFKKETYKPGGGFN